MGDPIATDPKSLLPPPLPPPAPAAQASSASAGGGGLLCLPRPGVRLTSEFDSDSGLFFQKVSCRLFDRLAKLKLSFQHDPSGAVAFPQLAFLTKHFSVLYDLHSANALLKGSLDLPGRLQLRATHDIKDNGDEILRSKVMKSQWIQKYFYFKFIKKNIATGGNLSISVLHVQQIDCTSEIKELFADIQSIV